MVATLPTNLLVAAALALPAAPGHPAPWTRVLAGLRQSTRAMAAARPSLADCEQACYARYNARMVQCYALPRGGLRVECLAQAMADFQACAEACRRP